MQLKKPKKCYADYKHKGYNKTGDASYERKFFWKFPEITDGERIICAQSCLPLGKDKIIDYLARYLSVSKDMRTSENKRAFRFADDSDVLFGFPEYAIVLGIVECIEEDVSNWYPSIAKLKKYIDGNIIKWPEIDQREGWEDVKS